MKTEKYLIVSPHSDDALFSCAHILLQPQYEVQVLTVENNPKRIVEDERLYDFLNIPFHHLKVDFNDDSYYGYHKQFKEVVVETALNYLREYFGVHTLNNIEKMLAEWLKQFLSSHRGYRIIAPWGIGHPFHLFIREAIQGAVSPSVLEYCREFPHSYKRRSQMQLSKQLDEYTLKRLVPVDEFHETKWRLASKFYRSQSGLLFYEQGYIKKRLPEEIYIKNNVHG